MAYAFLVLGVFVFLVFFKLLRIVPRIRAVFAATLATQDVIRSRDLEDEDKETIIQKAAISVAASTISILGRVALCLLVPAIPVWLGKQAGAYSTADILAAASDWMFIAASSVVMIAALAVLR